MYDEIKIKQMEDYLSTQSLIEFVNNLGKYSDSNKYPCIYHDDLYPSLFIDEENGIFYCFSCQRGGGLGMMIYHHYQQEYNVKYYYEALELHLKLNREAREALGFNSLKVSRNKVKVESLEEITENMNRMLQGNKRLEEQVIELKPGKASDNFEDILNFCIKIQNKIDN